MSRLIFHRQTPLQANVTLAKRWVPTLSLWGVGMGTAALLFLSVTPLVKREVLVKVPLLKHYFEDKTPDCDKPF
ncbi:hypothetical protein E1B28_002554 [Marasmius oreades]|uniref:Uncharacterized protein n=1 Tax=Marasmius oreades TaxID=181124 RepID=A0A9P7RN89_9AGAR|nr:uncharacterized protein E1B28_002554 [Marasmius oreades]KAG7086610.1 hypothetical protein E1B28_002554 [Marasmius oreades]